MSAEEQLSRYDAALAARFRAAFAYAGIKPKDIAVALGVSPRTVHRLENAQSEFDRDLQEQVSKVTGVPMTFLEHGFDPPEPELSERVEAVERQLATLPELQRQLRALRAGVTALSADSLKQTQERLALDGTDRPTERQGEAP